MFIFISFSRVVFQVNGRKIWIQKKGSFIVQFTSVYTNIRSCRRDELKTSFPYKSEYLYIHEYLCNKILLYHDFVAFPLIYAIQ